MNEPMHRKNKEGFGMQTKPPYDDEASKRGGPIFQKQVRCIAYHLTSRALHICFADIPRNKIPTGIQRDSHELKFL